MIKVKLYLGDIENLLALKPHLLKIQAEAKLENSPVGVVAGLNAAYVLRYLPRFEAVRTKIRNKMASQAAANYHRNQRALKPQKSISVKPSTIGMPEPLVSNLLFVIAYANATHFDETYRTLLNAAYFWQVNHS